MQIVIVLLECKVEGDRTDTVLELSVKYFSNEGYSKPSCRQNCSCVSGSVKSARVKRVSGAKSRKKASIESDKYKVLTVYINKSCVRLFACLAFVYVLKLIRMPLVEKTVIKEAKRTKDDCCVAIGELHTGKQMLPFRSCFQILRHGAAFLDLRSCQPHRVTPARA